MALGGDTINMPDTSAKAVNHERALVLEDGGGSDSIKSPSQSDTLAPNLSEEAKLVPSPIARMGGIARPYKPPKITRKIVRVEIKQAAGSKRKVIEHVPTQGSSKKCKTEISEHPVSASAQQENVLDCVKVDPKSNESKKRTRNDEDNDVESVLPPPNKRRNSTASFIEQSDELDASELPSAAESPGRTQQPTPPTETLDTDDETEPESDNGPLATDGESKTESDTDTLQPDDETHGKVETDSQTDADDELESDSETPANLVKGDQKTGISRFGLSCHLSVTVQMIDCILEGRSLDRFLGKVDELDQFDFCTEDFRNPDGVLVLKKKVQNKAPKLVQWLYDARASETPGKSYSVAARLSAFLGGLREGVDDFPASYLFNHVFAYSSEAREEFDGRSQQDCAETFRKVTEALESDHHFPGAKAFEKLFQTYTTNTISCMSHECEKKIERQESHKHLSLDLSRSTSKGPVNLSQLMDASLHSEFDARCECGADRTSTTAFLALPENLLLQINRVDYATDVKNTTALDLSFDNITIDDAVYQLHAVIKHKGDSAESGHYYILVKHGDHWLKLDDNLKTRVTHCRTVDNGRNGQTAMLHLKKIPVDDGEDSSYCDL